MTTKITGNWIEEKQRSGFTADDLKLMLLSSDEEAELLYTAARKVRDQVFGRKAFIRAVVEFANSCRCSCLYCGMRLNNPDGYRFSLGHDELLEIAGRAYKNGIRTFFLQAAESESYGAEWLRDVISDISKLGMGVLLCVGVHQESDLDMWREAGAYKFILKHETSDTELFERMKPGFTLEGRIEWLRILRKHGFHIGSGPLLGLPGQTIDSLVNDLILLKELKTEMSSVSVFVPASGTPLENEPVGDPELGLRFIAAMRLFLRNTLIPATSTFERLMENGQYRCFQAGANVITVNMTPQKLRDDYTIYTNRFYVGLEHARKTIVKAGLTETTEGELLS
ncbi:MAG: [FeFe] hydrogenase H-cluster radical SAM maturase HydE [Gemmatimonadaceae bacterium 4484_173]|nr:MAG: [FeFe] hydrogenase H-cluster radical SAM maturase HydE [Gemmatimonadaceae bacterium 4484_173]RKZ02628.1 MAG: [FeFe] hydrogenase H-cluster radical SAM maturase HydE [Candidatus Fermentibacteria bacterium]